MTSRLTVELGRNARADLAWLVEQEELNRTTIVNRAIQVYRLVVDAQLNGRHLYIGDVESGKAQEVRIV
jgi:hypothetical protein